MESPQRNVSTPPTSVSLAKEVDAEYDYTVTASTLNGFFDTVEKNDGDYIVFRGVKKDLFQKIEAARERRGKKMRFHYQPAKEQLLVTIPTRPHEVTNSDMLLAIVFDVVSMGLERDALQSTSATKYVGGGGSSSEGDVCFEPQERTQVVGAWPTLVVETGASQSLTSLRSKMEWWFSASDHAVKIVVIAKLTSSSHTILLEKYIKDVQQTRVGATNTRNRPGQAPQLRQSITITPKPDSNPVVYDVLGGPLILEFLLVFLRPADPSRGERDIVVDIPELAKLPQHVWSR